MIAEAIVRVRKIIERAEQGAREKVGSGELEAMNDLDAIKKSGLSKSTITSLRHVLTSLIEHLGLKPPPPSPAVRRDTGSTSRLCNPLTAGRHDSGQ